MEIAQLVISPAILFGAFIFFWRESKSGRSELENRLVKRMDRMENSLEARMHASENRLDARIVASENRLDARMDALEDRLDARMDALEDRLDTRIVALEDKIDGIETRIDEVSGYFKYKPDNGGTRR